jgi:glycosyltransferase involved in cell wall biosynthesis
MIVRTQQGRQEFLREALDSLKRQTFKNFEVLIVENGSHTLADLITLYKAEAPQLFLRYIPLGKTNHSNAGNVGLSKAQGQYIGFLEDDAQVFPEHLSVLVKALENHDDAPVAYAFAEIRETIVQKLQPLQYEEKRIFVPKSYAADFWQNLLSHNFIAPQAALFRRELYDHFGGLHEQLGSLDMWELWQRYAQTGMFYAVQSLTSFSRKPFFAADLSYRYRTTHHYTPRVWDITRNYALPLPLGMVRNASLFWFNTPRLKAKLKEWVYQSAWRLRLYRRVVYRVSEKGC